MGSGREPVEAFRPLTGRGSPWNLAFGICPLQPNMQSLVCQAAPATNRFDILFGMPIPNDLVATLAAPPTSELIGEIRRPDRPTGSRNLSLRNEIAPSDLYVYLGARFGTPNGLQNLLRKDRSDNLIHWEWMLRTPSGWILFQGMNFRTAVILLGEPSA